MALSCISCSDTLWNSSANHDADPNKFNSLFGFTIHRNQHSVAMFGRNGVIEIRSMKSGDIIATLNTPPLSLKSIAFCPCDDRLICCFQDGRVILCPTPLNSKDLSKSQEIHRFKRPIKSHCFSRNGCMMAVGNIDGSIICWNIKQQPIRKASFQHGSNLSAITFTPDDRHLVSAGKNGKVHFWNLDTETKDRTLSCVNDSPIETVTVSPNGQWIAIANCDGLVEIVSRDRSQSPWSFATEMRPVRQVVFSPDGKSISVCGVSDEILVGDLLTRHITMRIPISNPSMIAYSADGAKLYASTYSGTFRTIPIFADGPVE